MKVCFLHLDPVGDEPRVRRQADALHGAGYEVVAIGATGARSPKPAWRVIELELPRITGARRLGAMARQASSALGGRVAVNAYWSDRRRRAVLDAALRERADVYVAREWRTLPIGVELRKRTGAALAMDSPELSSEEREDSGTWRRFFRPMIVAIETRYLPEVQLVTAVSDGIASRLQERYGLEQTPTTVRNIPPYQECEFREPGDVIEVVFHGVMAVSRGIESVVGSVATWPDNVRLTLRGPSDPAYLDRLRELAGFGLDRIVFAPSVPMTELVTAASSGDVGIFALPDYGRQMANALPNKLFEYIMAGLAVCVSDLPAMASIVDEWGCGVKIERPFGPEQVSAAVHRMVASDIAAMKRSSLMAARELNWDRESERYLQVFAQVFGPPA